MTPLERWAARNPRVRWPLVWLFIFLLWGLGGAFDVEASSVTTLL